MDDPHEADVGVNRPSRRCWAARKGCGPKATPWEKTSRPFVALDYSKKGRSEIVGVVRRPCCGAGVAVTIPTKPEALASTGRRANRPWGVLPVEKKSELPLARVTCRASSRGSRERSNPNPAGPLRPGAGSPPASVESGAVGTAPPALPERPILAAGPAGAAAAKSGKIYGMMGPSRFASGCAVSGHPTCAQLRAPGCGSRPSSGPGISAFPSARGDHGPDSVAGVGRPHVARCRRAARRSRPLRCVKPA